MNKSGAQPSDAAREAASSTKETQTFIEGLWGVRYQVKDVRRAIAFYTQQLGFKLDLQNLPAFAQVSIGNLKLKKLGLCFRNNMEVGPGGKQIQLEDPDGNPIELFEPPR